MLVFLPRPVDVWATGTLITEMLTGEPLFPGDSDIDQLFHITKCLGKKSPSGSLGLLRNEGLRFVLMGGKITIHSCSADPAFQPLKCFTVLYFSMWLLCLHDSR